MYIYIYHVHLHRFVQNMPWPPVALLAPLPAPAPLRRCSTAPDPRAPRGPRGPALQQQDLQPHLLTVDLNQKTLETSSLLLLAFLDATTIKQKKKQKNKKNDSFKNCEDFSKTNLYHLLFIDFLSPFLYPPGCVTRFAAAALSAACTWCIKGPRLAAPAAFGRWRAHDFYPTRNGWLFLGGNSRTSKIIIWFII